MAKVYKNAECTEKAECPLKSAGFFANCSSDVKEWPYCDTLCALCDTEGFIPTGIDGIRYCRCAIPPIAVKNFYMED